VKTEEKTRWKKKKEKKDEIPRTARSTISAEARDHWNDNNSVSTTLGDWERKGGGTAQETGCPGTEIHSKEAEKREVILNKTSTGELQKGKACVVG